MGSSPEVLLVMLPYTGAYIPSLGLASVRAALEQGGTSAQILDLDYDFVGRLETNVPAEALYRVQNFENWVFEESFAEMLPSIEGLLQEYVRRIEETPSKLIGFSASDFTNCTTNEVIRRLRADGDRRPIILGGANCYLPAHMNRLSPQADAVLADEADETIVEFVRWFEAGRPGEPPAGVFIWDGNGKLAGKHRRPPMDLDNLSMPSYEGQEWPGHWGFGEFPILLSRGCVGRCAFCDVFARNGRFRTRGPEKVFEEIRHLRQTHPGLRLHFNDSLVNGHLPSLRRLCERMIAEGWQVPMIGQARARRDMTAEDYRLMRAAGFHSLLYGIETGSETVRQLMNKTQLATLDEVAESFRLAHDGGLRVGVNLIVGFPGETRRELEETAEFVLGHRKHIDLIASIACLSILPDTMIWNEPERYGIDPATKFTPAWKTADGENTLEERQWRRQWLYETLKPGGFEKSQLLADLGPTAPPVSFARRAVRKARRMLGRAKRALLCP